MDQPSGVATIVIEWVLISLSLFFVVLRLRIRLKHTKRLRLSDYLVGVGWLFALAGMICDCITYSTGGLDISDDDDIPVTVAMLELDVASDIFYYIGLYFTKGSLIALLFNVVPQFMTKTRVALYGLAGYLTLCFLASIFVYTFWCPNFSSNWSLDDGACSASWSVTIVTIEWGLNISCEVFIFLLPTSFIFKVDVETPKRIALIGIFMIGAITITISITRYIQITTTDLLTPIYIWAMAEETCSVIIACLPSLKAFFTKSLGSRLGNNNTTGSTISAMANWLGKKEARFLPPLGEMDEEKTLAQVGDTVCIPGPALREIPKLPSSD